MSIKNIFKICFLSILLTLFSTNTVFAYELINGQEVDLSQPLEDDAYVMGGNIIIDEEVFGDLYVMGGTVVIDTIIHEDLNVLAGDVSINGEVKGDVKVAGGRANLNGIVGDDYFVGSGISDIGPNAQIGGSVLTSTGIFGVDGVIDEDLNGIMGVFNFNGIVGKNMDITVQDSIMLAKDSRVEGDLKYNAILEANIPESIVGGQILFNKFEFKNPFNEVDFDRIFLAMKLYSYLTTLVFLLIFVLFTPKLLQKSAKLVVNDTFKAFGMGFLTLVLGFVGSLILMVTVIGFPIGLLLLNILILFLLFSKIFASYWLASYTINLKKKKHLKLKMFFMTALVLLAYYMISFIPYLGVFIRFAMFIIGIGAIVMTKEYMFKEMRKKGLV